MANIYPDPEQSGTSAFARERVSESSRAEEPSIAALLAEVVADAQSLVRKEVELAKQEVRVELGKAKDSAVSLGIGGAIAAVGGLMLVFMLVHLLSDLFDLRLWVSYLIVGALLAIVGVVNVPVVHYSVTWWNSLHQGATILKLGKPTISADMAIPLYASLLGSYLLAGYGILRRMQNDLLLRERRSTWVREIAAAAS